MGGDENVKVAVRVRPFNQREIDRNAKLIIKMSGPQTTITDPATGKTKTFSFDYSLFSHDKSHPEFVGQDFVYEKLGKDVLRSAWEGFNVSLFAYGQTGSGKSYSMVGYGEDKGIVPLASEEIFARIKESKDPNIKFHVEAAMMEIYNEQVRDLFNPTNPDNKHGLKIREHPKKGPYVDGLSLAAVQSWKDLEQMLDEGAKARTVASTMMNATSSRAHTIFQIVFTQTTVNRETGKAMDKTSRISLIDLAGSERVSKTGAEGSRLKEGAAINKSLSALGNCITALADNAGGKKKKIRVPYRDSALTFILRESLGGNARTTMIAAVSPADINFDESMSTLRYADRAKQIKNKATVNEDENAKLVRSLRAEIEELRNQIGGGGGGGGGGNDEEVQRLREQLEASERLMQEMNMSWEERLQLTAETAKQRQQLLADNGLTVSEMKEAFGVTENTPYLVNLNEDPMMAEALVYFLKDGETVLGRSKDCDIKLSGVEVAERHCIARTDGDTATLEPVEGTTFINGEELTSKTEVHQGDRIIIGQNHIFRFTHPLEAKKLKEQGKGMMAGGMDWQAAIKELMEKQGAGMQVGDPEREKEMQDKIQQLEKKMRQEQEAARRKLEDQRKENERKMASMAGGDPRKLKDLEEKNRLLQEEIERKKAEEEAFRKAKWQKMQERKDLEEKLQKIIPLIKEANAIADKFNKGISFELRVITKFPEVAALSPLEELRTMKQFDFGVKVVHSSAGMSLMWSYDKFCDRLYMMRELYYNVIEQQTMTLEDLTKEQDPFYEPPHDQLTGKAHVYLKGLAHGFPVKVTPPILDYKGKREGTLSVEIVPGGGWKPTLTPDELVGKPLEFVINVSSANGLPEQYSNEVYFSYTFFDHEEPYKCKRVTGRVPSPQFNYTQAFRIDSCSADFVEYLKTDAITFEIWGMHDSFRMGMRKQSSRAALRGLDHAKSFRMGNQASIVPSKGGGRRARGGDASGKTDVWEFSVMLEVQEVNDDGAMDYVTTKMVKAPGGRKVRVFRVRRDRPRRVKMTVQQDLGPFSVLEGVSEVRLGRSLGPYDKGVSPEFTEPFVCDIISTGKSTEPSSVSAIIDVNSDDLRDLGLYERTKDGEYRQVAVDIDVDLALADQNMTTYSEVLSLKVYDKDEKMKKGKLFAKEDGIAKHGSRYRCQLSTRRSKKSGVEMSQIMEDHEEGLTLLEKEIEEEMLRQLRMVDDQVVKIGGKRSVPEEGAGDA